MGAARKDRNGLRVTVRLHDTIVDQQVIWQPRVGALGPFEIGAHVPTASGGPLAQGTWREDGSIDITAVEAGTNGGPLGPQDQWHWDNEHGVTVDVDLVQRRPARRMSGDSWGDVALLVLMLTLMVGVGQINYLLRELGAALPTQETAYEPTPELIARLLQRDFDGEEAGRQQRADRPDAKRQAPSFYLPAGQEGDWSRAEGGKDIGEEVVRGPEPKPSEPERQVAEPKKKAEDAVNLKADVPTVVADAAPQTPKAKVEVELAEDTETSKPLSKPIERFIGWGFKDWFEVEDGRAEQEERIARILEMTRVRLKIDPDDPHAIQTAAYYAYLSENHELGAALHQRFIDLYPEDPSGYNNLALTHKRKGEYKKEEVLYRKALKLDPLDHHVINNLAVNLAHQGRYEEALRLMATLEELTPGDPYADLHRAKIYAAMGKKRQSYKLLKRALAGVDDLDTLHHIEFRQDIRVDPAFDEIRGKWGFRRILRKEYGDDADSMVGKAPRRWWQKREVGDG